MKYMDQYSLGYAAALSAAEPHTNPHAWKTPPWWAWHAGWEAGKAHMKDQFEGLLDAMDNTFRKEFRRV